MPEYVCPGVYVEELGTEFRPIPPVPLDDPALKSIATELRRAVAVHAPQWTGSNESDPGTTLLELFAFLGESLEFRTTAPPGTGLTRPAFFKGRLLDAAALSDEQHYNREKRRRHNLALFGWGVVSGLGVTVEPGMDSQGSPGSGGPRVVVEPGYAIDPRGEEVSVPCCVTLPPPTRGERAFVTIRFWERPCMPVPVSGGGASASASTIEEACILGMAADVVLPAFALARLVGGESGWRVDPAFSVARISR